MSIGQHMAFFVKDSVSLDFPQMLPSDCNLSLSFLLRELKVSSGINVTALLTICFSFWCVVLYWI